MEHKFSDQPTLTFSLRVSGLCTHTLALSPHAHSGAVTFAPAFAFAFAFAFSFSLRYPTYLH